MIMFKSYQINSQLFEQVVNTITVYWQEIATVDIVITVNYLHPYRLICLDPSHKTLVSQIN